MARKAKKTDAALLVMAVVIGLPVLAVMKVIESVGWVVPVIVIVLIVAFVIWNKSEKAKQRLEYLREKYGDEGVVQKILGGTVWQGQSEEQLKDTLGAPVAVDRAALKTKIKETWKYNHKGGNRYGLRVIVENGFVIGWDQKS